jgi:predicted AAA+ superfamily ATPase
MGIDIKPYKRVAFFEAMKMLEHPSIRRFPILSGARRVGKTTIMYQMMDSLIANNVPARNILYISFDNPIVKLSTINDVLDKYQEIYPDDGSQRYFFFDEIQYSKNWELWMKVIYDSMPLVRLVATGSASPVIAKGATDSGTGRWSILKIPTLSFFEYCTLLKLDPPKIPDGLHFNDFSSMRDGELADLMNRFNPLLPHFNRYMVIGGFPELVMSTDDEYAQRMLREDVVDKVIKRDVLTLYNVRNPLSMEKLFLYLSMNSSELFSAQTASRELDGISVKTVEDYIGFLEKSNLIYISPPLKVGSRAVLKGKPKIYIADAAIRNAVLMIYDVISDEAEMGIMVETAVFKHIISYCQNNPSIHVGYFRKSNENQKEVDVVIEMPSDNVLCEVKYRNKSQVSATDAIVELSNDPSSKTSSSFIITKSLLDVGKSQQQSLIPITRMPALPFLYMLGWSEANRKKMFSHRF